MKTLINFIHKPAGSTLGFAGIALTWLCAGIFDTSPGVWGIVMKIALIGVALFFVYLAILCQRRGTVRHADAGIVLAYLGIGVGLICTALGAPSNGALAWICLISGICLELVGLLLLHHAGLIRRPHLPVRSK